MTCRYFMFHNHLYFLTGRRKLLKAGVFILLNNSEIILQGRRLTWTSYVGLMKAFGLERFLGLGNRVQLLLTRAHGDTLVASPGAHEGGHAATGKGWRSSFPQKTRCCQLLLH